MAKMTTGDGTPTDGANPWIDSLISGGSFVIATPGQPVALKYFLPVPEIFGSLGTDGWGQVYNDAIAAAFQTWAAVTNVTFTRVDSAENADLIEELDYTSMPSSLLGSHRLPLLYTDGPLFGQYNMMELQDSPQKPGYIAFATMVHEIGHALGLSHPHDPIGSFPGVTKEYGELGEFNLNQNVYSVMSYNRYQNVGSHSSGHTGSPMALDIAAIQLIYGANTSTNTSDNFYSLLGKESYTCIWDAGGNDTIAHLGYTRTRIDLRAATLIGESAGGFISFATPISIGVFSEGSTVSAVGGFTIANGVVIENAIGGSSRDVLIGNEVANRLSGGRNNDSISGGLGVDTLMGGKGIDRYIFTSPQDGGDNITKFEKGEKVVLHGEAFGYGSYVGKLKAANFKSGTNNKAGDANDFFIYRTTDDTLWFDADGKGTTAPIKIADLTNNFDLSNNDILMI